MDFRFLHTPDFRKWIILDPRRSQRPDISKGTIQSCPFCTGNEKSDEEVYRIEGGESWSLRVVNNRFAFASIHEVIIHSPDHHKNIDELPTYYVLNLLKTYRSRAILHSGKGQVYIFHNRGIQAGESISHPHTQLVVIPSDVPMSTPAFSDEYEQKGVTTDCFHLFAPKISQWPDEIWIVPLEKNKRFVAVTDREIADLAVCLPQVIRLFDLRHGHEFPFNYYIYPGNNWYLRLIPRQKSLGGLEVGTDIYVNTQDPVETDSFLRQHYALLELTHISEQHKASYRKHV